MSAIITDKILQQLYQYSSLTTTKKGVSFSIKNRLSDAVITRIITVKINEYSIPLENITLFSDETPINATQVTKGYSIDFPLRKTIVIDVIMPKLDNGPHKIHISVETTPFGSLTFDVDDLLDRKLADSIPRNNNDDYNIEIIKQRQSYIEKKSGITPNHITNFSFNPDTVRGNIENFTGVAQVPIGFAGPVNIKGEHAVGEFVIPMATTEGTLVASYNRGIKLLNLSGGVTCTVIGDAMQRAPVFVFKNARSARDFVQWCKDHIESIRSQAELTSNIIKLQYIDYYLSNKFAYLRFNFYTGDAAGQNMAGKATYAACNWILENIDHKDQLSNFYLESNLATDKKASQINTMHTRGKRVVAEVTISRENLISNMRVTPEQLLHHNRVANIGAFISGVNNNGLHSANAITALFIATGQDVANVAESSTGIIYAEMTPDNNFYVSITIPSLIIGSYGGGTGLATQRECLEILGCAGQDKVNKLAEIIAGVVLAGELSLASAVSSSDWVSSHEKYGRNR